MKKITKLTIAMVAAMTVGGLMPTSAFAQNDPRDQVIPTVNFQQAEIREALKILFRNVGVNYSVANDVTGFVTASLSNVPFETALRNLLDQVEATYRFENGIYSIIHREKETSPLVPNGQKPDDLIPQADRKRLIRLHIRHADPQYVFTLLLGRANFTTQPEISALSLFGGGGGFGGGGFGGGGNGGFGGGGNGFGGGGFGGGGFDQGGGGFGGGGFGGGGFGGGGAPGKGGGSFGGAG